MFRSAEPGAQEPWNRQIRTFPRNMNPYLRVLSLQSGSRISLCRQVQPGGSGCFQSLFSSTLDICKYEHVKLLKRPGSRLYWDLRRVTTQTKTIFLHVDTDASGLSITVATVCCKQTQTCTLRPNVTDVMIILTASSPPVNHHQWFDASQKTRTVKNKLRDIWGAYIHQVDVMFRLKLRWWACRLKPLRFWSHTS